MNLFEDKPRRYSFGPIKIHLYRMPIALGLEIFKNKNQLTWERWEQRIKEVCPFQFWIRKKLIDGTKSWLAGCWRWNIRGPVRDTIRKYTNPSNKLHIKTLGIYADEREQVLHSLFQILCNFVDINPHEYVSMDLNPHLKDWWPEVLKWHLYWTIERPKLELAISDAYPPLGHNLPYEEAYKKVNDLEKELNEKDLAGMTFIITTRENFWI